MFETAILRKHGEGFTSVDAGLIAETLLFYSNVHVVAHFGVLVDLLRTIGGATLLRLVEDDRITVTYLRTDFATLTATQSGIEFHEFGGMKLRGTGGPHGTRINTKESVLLAFERALGASWKTRRLANRFLKKLKFLSDIKVQGQPRGIPGLASTDLNDESYVREAIKAALAEIVPTYALGEDFRFDILRVPGGGFTIDHNLDLREINAKFRERYPASEISVTLPLLIGQLLEARVDLQLCSKYLAELVTNSATGAIVRKKLAALMEKRDNSISQMELFQKVHLNDGRAIREAISSGERTFDEFMRVLDKAAPFKEWLRSRNPDGNLLDEYYRAVSEETWINQLPAKIVRFFLALGLGSVIENFFPSGVGMATAIGLEAADHLLLDRVFQGWRPNEFIEGPLQRFSS